MLCGKPGDFLAQNEFKPGRSSPFKWPDEASEKDLPGEYKWSEFGMDQTIVKQLTCARIPTSTGEFQLCYYGNNLDDKEHLALLVGDVRQQENVLVRVHSECFTGDVLGSLRCDCGPQLQKAIQLISQQGAGVIIYMRQEGRGIGLLDKLRAYNLR